MLLDIVQVQLSLHPAISDRFSLIFCVCVCVCAKLFYAMY